MLAQPLHSAASLLAQMELHGIASAKTVAPPDEVADAATAVGEAPDAATLRPPQGADLGELGASTGPAPDDAASAARTAADTTSVQEGPARQHEVERPSAAGGADDWQSQLPPASGLLSPFIRDPRASGEPSTPTSTTPDLAPSAGQQEPMTARRTGSGGAEAQQQLPDLGSGFGPADVPLRRSASDAGASGSWPPFDAAAIAADSAVSAGGSGRHGSDELPGGSGGGGGRQLRSRSAVPAPVGAHTGPLAPASLFSLAGAVLSQRCRLEVSACSEFLEGDGSCPVLRHDRCCR